jgi:pimeloyl-ACP methyl ester carboxylesterase
MYRVRNWLLLPGFLIVSSLLLLLRYVLKTPQPLASLLPGSDHLYKWTHGHIFYKVYGNSDAPPLLLLHAPGIGASAHEMLPIMEKLAPHYHIYAPDLLGYGLSDTPDIDYTAATFVALCSDFLRDVVQQPATLLGHGLSCEYTLAVAARSPELCTRLVLLSPR